MNLQIRKCKCLNEAGYKIGYSGQIRIGEYKSGTDRYISHNTFVYRKAILLSFAGNVKRKSDV